MLVSEPYRELLDRIFAEVEGQVPGLKTFKHNFGILLSSPKAQAFYHADVPGQTLWQIRGRKRVYVYPTEAPFISAQAFEKIILKEVDEQAMVYEPWFDDEAMVIDLEPGQMLHWPLNAPHRVLNLDCFNISVTIEYLSPEILASYAVHYANGILRRHGFQRLGNQQSGPSFWAKVAIAALHRYSGVQNSREYKSCVDFVVDPRAPGGFIDIPRGSRR